MNRRQQDAIDTAEGLERVTVRIKNSTVFTRTVKRELVGPLVAKANALRQQAASETTEQQRLL
jgi:hypothetical protein